MEVSTERLRIALDRLEELETVLLAWGIPAVSSPKRKYLLILKKRFPRTIHMMSCWDYAITRW